MAEIPTVPTVPFFFRIYSPDNQGIVYRADRQLDPETYMCTGSRQIGVSGNKKIWVMGGYADAMPLAAMYQIIDKRITPLTKEQSSTIDIGQEYKMPLYTDGFGFWFNDRNESNSRERARSSSRPRLNPKNKSQSKSKSKSPNTKGKKSGKKSGKSKKTTNA